MQEGQGQCDKDMDSVTTSCKKSNNDRNINFPTFQKEIIICRPAYLESFFGYFSSEGDTVARWMCFPLRLLDSRLMPEIMRWLIIYSEGNSRHPVAYKNSTAQCCDAVGLN